MVRKFPNLMKGMKLHIARISKNSKQDKLKEIDIDTYYNQSVGSKRQRENLDSSKREVVHYTQGILNKIERQFIIRNQGG